MVGPHKKELAVAWNRTHDHDPLPRSDPERPLGNTSSQGATRHGTTKPCLQKIVLGTYVTAQSGSTLFNNDFKNKE